MLRLVFVALIGLILTGCSRSPTSDPADSPRLQEDRAAVVKGNNRFAVDLYQKLSSRDGNLFLSPYSISTALGMTYAGAKGQTADQMAKALHFPGEPARLHPAFASLIHESRNAKDFQLHVANALWCQQNYPFRADYLDLVGKHYGAGAHGLDFAKADEARQTINAWVAKETRDKIPQLLAADSLSPNTTLVLTNAVYFQAKWKIDFAKKGTYDQAFHVSPDQHVLTPMMHQLDQHPYFDGNTFQALKLNYEKDRVAMVVLLPRRVDGLAELEKALTADQLAEWLKSLQTREVEVTLPRLKLRSAFRLKEALSALGMPAAFTPAADLTGISDTKELFIGDVIHEATVDVDEEGTVAAAATAVLVEKKDETKAPAPPRPIIFRADRPFLFLIRDEKTGSILFLGRVANPKS